MSLANDKELTITVRFTLPELDILSYVEQVYWESGYLPTQEAVAKALGKSIQSIRAFWRKPEFIEAIEKKGIARNNLGEGVLTPAQTMVVNALLNVSDRSTLRQTLKLFNVTSTQYYNWLNDPAFQGYLRKRAEKLFEFSDADAYKALLQAVQDGDVNAIKFFFELRGIYNPKLQINVNVNALMTEIIKIITDNVTDVKTIETIAKELEAVADKAVSA